MKNELDKARIVFEEDWTDLIVGIENSFLIIDKNVFKIYSTRFQPLINSTKYYLFEASEKNKSFSELQKILLEFQSTKLNRNSVIICIGGGITTDIGGLAASLYMRGCRLILIPTTFLGMIDASIGGKTAVNYRGIKNNLGTFYPAEKVIIMTDFLKTLPPAEMKKGWAECMKAALISSSGLLELLQKSSFPKIEEIIRKAVSIKMAIVEADLREKGQRRILNLGHTFGHVIESVSDYHIAHGDAVSIGICVAAYVSWQLAFLPEKDYLQIIDLFKKFDLATKLESHLTSQLIDKGEIFFELDKKKTVTYNFVLLRAIGDAFVYSTQNLDRVFSLFCDYLK